LTTTLVQSNTPEEPTAGHPTPVATAEGDAPDTEEPISADHDTSYGRSGQPVTFDRDLIAHNGEKPSPSIQDYSDTRTEHPVTTGREIAHNGEKPVSTDQFPSESRSKQPVTSDNVYAHNGEMSQSVSADRDTSQGISKPRSAGRDESATAETGFDTAIDGLTGSLTQTAKYPIRVDKYRGSQ
jgi:hypothetical protein